jgi:hypothetical protein
VGTFRKLNEEAVPLSFAGLDRRRRDVILYAALPAEWTPISRLLAWDVGVTLFLLMIFPWMRSLTARQLDPHDRHRA